MELIRLKIKKDYGVILCKSSIDQTLRKHFYYGIMEIRGKRYPHKYPTIITKELFDQAQKVKDGFKIKEKILFNKKMVRPTGIEPVTYRLGICRSILLSYGRTQTFK